MSSLQEAFRRRTDRGHIVLTGASFTEWRDGVMEKEELAPHQFQERAEAYFRKW